MEASSQKSLHLTLIRHGESVYNKKNLFTGWLNAGLTENGTNEAQNGGELIKSKGITYSVGYTSFLARAQLTYKEVAKKLEESSGKFNNLGFFYRNFF
jgi:2,3-bisphosphoglycerate-dependent phosphoglycerate mutase